MKDLFLGTGIAHSILVFAFVIASGMFLGKYKVKGISIGTTWILFVGIVLSHFGIRVDPTVMGFVKDFGLILFIFSIGLQVGPGFFHSFKKGGLTMNLLALLLVLLAVGITFCIHLVTGESLQTMVGVMSGAVTNTPGLGAAQQTLSDVLTASGGTAEHASAVVSSLASSYAVAYPLGVLGVIVVIILLKTLFKVDLETEQKQIEHDDDSGETARRMHCMVENPAIFGKRLKEVVGPVSDKMVVSRILRDGVISLPGPDTVLQQGDKLLIVTSQAEVETVRIIFGEEIPMHQKDWMKMDEKLVTRRLATRILRAGVELVAGPNLYLQMGDSIQVVGTESSIQDVAKLVGNKPETLSHPNLVPIFFGIVLGVIFGSIPFKLPGIPQPVKLGLAGGPLIVAILLGHFGPKWKITTYTTLGANMMIREMGIALFLAAVGLGAGGNFVSSILSGGYWWILYGALITIIPVLTVGLLARLAFRLNFYQICGLLSGGMTDPAVLAFAQGAYGTDHASVNYATVYPLTMFLRVLMAQLLILFAL